MEMIASKLTGSMGEAAGSRTGGPVRPIRVCFLIDRLYPGGTELQLLSLLRNLDRSRVEPLLCLLDGGDDVSRSLEPSNVPALRLGTRVLCSRDGGKACRTLARFLRRERIEILQTYFADSSYVGIVAARLAGVRKIIRTRFNLGHWLTPGHRWAGRLASRLIDATVVNCAECRDAVIADEWTRPGTVHIIPNGIDYQRFASIPALDSAGRRPTRVGMIANLRPIKDPGLLVEAAGLLVRSGAAVEFLLAGTGELRPILEAAVAETGLSDCVRFAGPVGDVPAFLAGVELAVLTSRAEGLPNAVLEYMAAGRAVVATAVGGTVDLIEDGVHGLLVPPGDPGRLAEAMGRLMNDPPLAARLGSAARHRVAKRYDAGARARCYEELYETLLSS